MNNNDKVQTRRNTVTSDIVFLSFCYIEKFIFAEVAFEKYDFKGLLNKTIIMQEILCRSLIDSL